jgi:Flp pilus assembly protein TadG
MKHQLLTHASYRSARQHGGAAVELALILIVIITMMAGIFEFGRVFWYYEALTKATRDGARMISISPKATIASVAVGSAKTLVVNSVLAANVPAFTAANVAVTCLTSALADGICTDGTAPGGVRVQITGYTITIGLFSPFYIPGSSTSITANPSPHTTMVYMPAEP